MKQDAAQELFEQERSRLKAVAYRMLGSVQEADDVLQEAWIRLARVTESIARPEAWLTTVVTRLAIDRFRSAQHRRETYVGPWLPEPTYADDVVGVSGAIDPQQHLLMLESLSVGFLFLLERLSPLERAAFLLYDVFGLSMTEVAEVVERTVPATRQLAKRAREHIQGRTRYVADPKDVAELSDAFMLAAFSGDLQRLQTFLHDDAVSMNDGGAQFRASRRPVIGKERVARLMVGLIRKIPSGMTAHTVRANGQFAYYLRIDGNPMMVIIPHWLDGQIAAIYGIRNEEKLVAFDEAWRAAG